VQLTTVGQELWKGARKAEQLQEVGAGNATVRERLQKLKLVKALRKRKVDWSEIKELVGISRATYYRWQRRLKEEGLKGLAPKPRRPRHLRQKVCWTPELLAQIEALRKQNPTWGRWPIWLALRKQNRQVQGQAQAQSQSQAQTQTQAQGQSQSQGCQISERTVGRILAYLEAHGRIESVASFLARARRGKRKRRTRRPYAQRKPRAYQVNQPGDLIQVDTLTVTLGPGEVIKHFSAVGSHSCFFHLPHFFHLPSPWPKSTPELRPTWRRASYPNSSPRLPSPSGRYKWTAAASSWPSKNTSPAG